MTQSPKGHVKIARILVVDDDEMVRFSLCKILEGHGFDVACAKDVNEALLHISTAKVRCSAE